MELYLASLLCLLLLSNGWLISAYAVAYRRTSLRYYRAQILFSGSFLAAGLLFFSLLNQPGFGRGIFIVSVSQILTGLLNFNSWSHPGYVNSRMVLLFGQPTSYSTPADELPTWLVSDTQSKPMTFQPKYLMALIVIMLLAGLMAVLAIKTGL